MSRSATIRLAVLWALLAALMFAGIGRSLWTPDEPREAELGREMYVHPGVIPTLNGTPFVEKPPLYYWIVGGLFSATGGPSPEAARAVSGASGLLTLVVLFVWASDAVSRRAAVAAVVMLATSAQFLMATHWILLDPLLMLFCTIAWWSSWKALHGGGAPGWVALFWGSLALALWTKGLVGPVIVLVAVAVHVTVDRKTVDGRRLRPIAGLVSFGVALAVLGAAIFAAGGMRALWEWAWVNHVQRFTNPGALGHREPFYYYAKAMLVVVLPWLVPFADALTPRFWRRLGSSAGIGRFCAAVVVAGVLILSLSVSKRENYLLPLVGPIFILLGMAVERRIVEGAIGTVTGWRRVGEWLQTGLVASIAIIPGVIAVGIERSPGLATTVWIVLAIVAAAGGLLATGNRETRLAAGFAGSGAIVFAFCVLLVAMPAVEPWKSLAPFLHDVDAFVPKGETVHVVGVDETLLGIIPFDTGRAVDPVDETGLLRHEHSGGLPPWVVLQIKDRLPSGSELVKTRYERIDLPGLHRVRNLSLWRRIDGSALSAPRGGMATGSG